MESPQLAWEFMKKLANSPWAPVIRLIEDPAILGSEPKLDLREDLEDCAVVVEETDSPGLREDLDDCAVVVEETDTLVQEKTPNAEDSSEEDSDSVPRICPSSSDSDDSVVARGEIERSKPPTHNPSRNGRLLRQSCGSATDSRVGKRHKPQPKSKKPVLPSSSSFRKSNSKAKQSHLSSSHGQVSEENDSGDATVVPSCKGETLTKSLEYNRQWFKLKPLKIVLIDVANVHTRHSSPHSRKPIRYSGDERGETTGRCRSPKVKSKSTVISSDDETTDESSKNSGSSNVDNLKRPYNLSWGLDSIHELEKRRKLGKHVKTNDDDDVEVELVTPCSSEAPCAVAPTKSVIASRSKSKPVSGPLPDNTFGLNAWRLGLVMQELKRLQELAESLQKNHVKFDLQKQIAYKFKYGLNEVARLVTKKSLNSIVAKQGKLEMLREIERRVCNEVSDGEEAAPESMQLLTEAPPSSISEQLSSSSSIAKELCKLEDRGSYTTATSKRLGPASSGRPVVDVHMPTLVQGVAAGFLRIIDCMERLESRCDRIENTVSKSKETSRSIDIGEVD